MVSAALDRLMGWHRDGVLGENFTSVPGVLAGIADEELTAAGQLLSRIDPDAARADTLTVAITGHGTVAGLVAPLAGELARHGLLLRPVVGTFGGYLTELGDPGSDLRRCGAPLTLCVLDPMVVFDEVPAPWTAEDVREALDRKLSQLEGLAARFAGDGTGTLVLNTLPLPHRCLAQLLDERSRAALGAMWREANARLLGLVAGHENVTVIDLDPLIAEGIPAVDPRLSAYAGMHLSPALLARYARQAGHLARRLTGRTRKCLVTDLDETLWGGVLAEDGADGLQIGGTRRGEAFLAFQGVVRQLASQGVLLAAASKNDRGQVLDVLRDHPDMTLRPDDFVRVAATWGAKHHSLAELARGLDLGVDSFVFVDDSPTECGLIRQELPQVAVVPLSAEPAHHVDRLLRDDWFGVRELTGADRERPGRYRQEARRAEFRESFDAVEAYLAELGLTVRLGAVSEREVPRVSQLTLRTNQFHLATRRLRPPDVRALAAAPGSAVLTVGSADRFGDNGLVGALFLRRRGDHAHIENFLLSCRVLTRGIEQACLATVLRHARDSGMTAVFGHYEPTAKNRRFGGFYPDNGFTPVAAEGQTRVFRHDLSTIPPPPGHVRVIGDLKGVG